MDKKSLFKKLLISGAVIAAAAAAYAVVKAVKNHNNLLPGSDKKKLSRAKNIYISGNNAAALAAAAYLIKDGGYDGSSIHIYGTPVPSVLCEEYGSVGPCLHALMKDIDACADEGYGISPLLDSITFAAAPEVRIIDAEHTSRAAALRPDRETLKALSRALRKFASSPADEFKEKSVSDYFGPQLLKSDLFMFIEMTFGIRPEHKVTEFLARLEQMLTYAPKPGLYDTMYYDFSTVSALEEYLEEHGAQILRSAEITGIDTENDVITALHAVNNGTKMTIYPSTDDLVIITAGSISDNISEGSFSEAAPIIEEEPSSKELWKLASIEDDSFGIPELMLGGYGSYIEFSIADDSGYLLNKICRAAECDPDNGVSVLFPNSNWHMKLSSEPYCMCSSVDLDAAVNAAADTTDDTDGADITQEDMDAAKDIAVSSDEPQPVINVKGVYCDAEGNYIDKTMRECTGVELLYELCGHLGLLGEWDDILEHIKIVMINSYPYKTAPLFNVPDHARPELRPCGNCVVIGDFIETDAPSCTLEQEIQSARRAAYELIGKKPGRVRSKYADPKRL